MKFIAKVYEPMYDFNDKKYIRYIIPVKVSEIIERMHTNKTHLLMNQNIDNPLDGTILTVKVPFRYRRVMCNVLSLYTSPSPRDRTRSRMPSSA